MRFFKVKYCWAICCFAMFFTACKTPDLIEKSADTSLQDSFGNSNADNNIATLKWKDYFKDENLQILIDTALKNNQELNILMLEIQIAKNEIRDKKGEYLPFVGIKGASEVEKVGRYTSKGANDANTDIKPGKEMPEPLGNHQLVFNANWELDIWHKLRNAKKAALTRYLSSIEGKNFMLTNLISEIANSYYELLSLDNQLQIVRQTIENQTNALKAVRQQMKAAKVNKLAVKKFEAEVYGTKSLEFEIQQKIIETENKINFLVGRYPQTIQRNSDAFVNALPAMIASGIPSQILQNRRDIKQAELELEAAKLDVSVARARFYPSLALSANIGLQAFNPTYLVKAPESILYSLGADLMAPLINRNAIKASYYNANAKQIQAVYNYEQTILNAYIEVVNQLSNIANLDKSYDLKSKKVQALTQSITISTNLFKSARADYMEVLLTQRDALESRFELIETKKQQLNAMVNIYQALGGGWN